MKACRQYLTILGIGNIGMQDDGFGVHFLAWFGNRYAVPDSVRPVSGGVLGYGLFDTVTSCDHLIIIDTVNVEDAPGSLYRFTMNDMQFTCPPSSTAGETAITDILCKAELIELLPLTMFLCIVPEQYRIPGTEMSPVMRKRFPDVERLLLKELAVHEIVPVRKGWAEQEYTLNTAIHNKLINSRTRT